MPWINCQICNSKFYAKPRHIKIGWGKYCSKKCQNTSQKIGKIIQCGICSKKIYRAPAQIRHSKSGKLFCSKSCSAVWRNKTVLAGEKHVNWKGGESAYRRILLRNGQKMVCAGCGLNDERVLIAHHKDQNRKNNSVENLCWLCQNCHYLTHYYP